MLRSFRGNIPKYLLVLCFILSGGAFTVAAETLQKYREDLNHVRDDLTYLYSISDEGYDKDWTKADQIKMENDFFAELPGLVPPREIVEWNGLSIEVDNRWLHARLEKIKNRNTGGAYDAKEHDALVTELEERLASLEVRFAELEKLQDNGRNKNTEKQKLEEILGRAEYKQPGEKEKSAIERWVESLLDWIAGLLPKPAQTAPMPAGTAPAIPPVAVLAVVAILVAAIILFVLWRFMPVFRNRRKLKKDKKEKRERVILGERLAEDESSVTLFGQAEQMAREGNFRDAIRKGYIAMLCELGDRKVVRLEQHKTNRDYLRDLKKDLELHGDVGNLTFLFENHWYGLATATEEEWSVFRDHYRQSAGKL